MIAWLWTDYCTVDNESLPMLIICLKHSKTIEFVCLSDILKFSFLRPCRFNLTVFFICRYPMLSRQNMEVLIRFRLNLSVLCVEPLSMCVPNFIRIALTVKKSNGSSMPLYIHVCGLWNFRVQWARQHGGGRRQRRDHGGLGGTLAGVSSPHSAFSKVAEKSFSVFNWFGPNLVCLLAVPEEDRPPTLKKIRQL